ncbi:MAG: DUF6351 family protein [Vicinamibacterales bacterium]
MRSVRSACSAVALVVALSSTAWAQSALRLHLLSNPKPEMVSGGDVLVAVDAGSGPLAGNVSLTLNGVDVSSTLRPEPSGSRLLAIVNGLRIGSNTIVAARAGAPARTSARLVVVNHPITGPVLSGPHQQPFACETEKFKLVAGGTAGPSLDANCSIATRIDYVYKSTAGGDLKPLTDPRSLPSDVATTTTSLGARVPYVVRVETGTINRAIYEMAMLHNPASEPTPDPFTRSAGWNGRLIYTFGGGCAGGWYRQGATTGGVDDDVMLLQGYAVASASLNTFGNNCSEHLAVETMMMVKEHFIEAYGVPLFTVGWGGSGGSYQQHQIADGYPGLLDGIMPARSFPDLEFGTVPMVTDSRLLANYFQKSAVPYTDEQKRQIAGLGALATLTANSLNPGRITVGEYCPAVPEAQRFDQVKNPGGVRCDIYDHAVNVWGRDPKTGFARRPLDNAGVQYGLRSLNAGIISKEQFLDLNEKIGGFGVNGEMVAARTVADPMALRIAYRTGRMTWGGAGLAATAIIDYRAYLDDANGGNIHLRYHSFSMRERLVKANGSAENHVMLTDDRRWGDSLKAPVLREGLAQMDAWLTRLAADTSPAPKRAKLLRAKPADLVDACWTRDEKPQKLAEKQMPNSGRCDELYPTNSFPRGVAGAGLAADVIKCQLKPVSAADYKVPFTADDMKRLKAIFPAGVCDWSKPGVDQQPMAGTWQTFMAAAPATGATR